jgi:hypothetical protein
MKKLFLTLFITLTLTATASAEWKIGDFTDKFGDEIGEHFIYQNGIGLFSNSATINSDCSTSIIVSDKYIQIKILEYFNNPVLLYNSATLYLKNSKGEKLNIDVAEHGVIDSPDNMIDFLKDAIGKVKCVIVNEHNFTWNFSIDATMFAKTFKTIYPKYTSKFEDFINRVTNLKIGKRAYFEYDTMKYRTYSLQVINWLQSHNDKFDWEYPSSGIYVTRIK